MKQKYLLFSIILSVFLLLFFTTSLALIPGDFGSTDNGPSDGVVDFEDLMIFSMTYGSTPSDSNWNPICDIAGTDDKLTPDGVIDFEDLMVFAMHYGECEEETSQSLISISDSAVFDGKTVINGGEHTITVKFPGPLRVFIANYRMEDADILRNFWGIPSNACEILMSTADGKTYTGTADFGESNCSEEWIYVLTGDSCCPVIYSRTVTVDTKPPYVDLKAVVGEEEDCGTECELALGKRVIITSDAYVENDPPLCTPLCCGDDCTELAEWTIAVYDALPFMEECGECVLDPCVSPIKVCTRSGGPVECDVFGCIPYADLDELFDRDIRDIKDITEIKAGGVYCVILEADDVVGNTYKDIGILVVWVIDITVEGFFLPDDICSAFLFDLDLNENCQFDLDSIIEEANMGRAYNIWNFNPGDYIDIIMGSCIY